MEDAFERTIQEWGRFERYRTWLEMLRLPCNQPLYDFFGMNGFVSEVIGLLWNDALLAAVNLTTDDPRADTSLKLLVDELNGDEKRTAMKALETARAAVKDTGAEKWRNKYVAHTDKDRATACSPVHIEDLTEISAKTHEVLRCITRFQNADLFPMLVGADDDVTSMLVHLDLVARLGRCIAAHITNEDGQYDGGAAQALRKTLDAESEDEHFPFFNIQMECFGTAELEGWHAAYEAARHSPAEALEKLSAEARRTTANDPQRHE